MSPLNLRFHGGPFDGGVLRCEGEQPDVAPPWFFHQHQDDFGQASVYRRDEYVDASIPFWRYEYLDTVPVIPA